MNVIRNIKLKWIFILMQINFAKDNNVLLNSKNIFTKIYSLKNVLLTLKGILKILNYKMQRNFTLSVQLRNYIFCFFSWRRYFVKKKKKIQMCILIKTPQNRKIKHFPSDPFSLC